MPPAAAPPPTRVVLYHSVGPVKEGDPGWRPGGGGMITPAEVLETHIALLRGLGYRFASAGELAKRWPGRVPPPGIAVLTFDDGWSDGLTTVAPLLNRLGLRATFFVCPGGFGNHPPALRGAARIMTEAEARALHEAGMELASHTLSHRNLLELSDADLRLEFEGSREAVEALTGQPCLTLAYPTGRHDPRIERAAAAAGYGLAFACKHGPWRRFAAPRVQAPTISARSRVLEKLRLSPDQPERQPE
jgi:peptidoglycan/xylan/chitin deacetylase (PgdA/CDA1 family)